ncbi:MAG: type I 3-dehydroquinate dehydratase [Parasporobacterium sp.]|nr:type I 3-dehydroquinate dehydratase [Parasporobacterium sp.]
MIKALTIKNVVIGEGRTKIAVSLMGKTKEEIIEEAKEAVDSRCDIIEWRADYFDNVMDFSELRQVGEAIMKLSVNKPVIFTFRTIEEGGEKAISLSEYKALMNVVSEGKLADLVDIQAFLYEDTYINDDIFNLIKKIKADGLHVIVSNHNFMKTPSQVEIVARYLGMQKLGADIVKMAVMPATKYDVITMLSATEEMVENYANVPVISIVMGKEGIVSRISGEFLGSAISFAALKKSSAPGQMNVNELFIILDKFHRAYGNYSGSEIEESLINIFIVGFMGTGKTAVSKVLSDIKGMVYVDVDEEIVNALGMTIPDIFKEKSEEYFRSVETKVLSQIAERRGQIVACGGGIVLKDENIEIMKKHGIVVRLDAPAEEIYARISEDSNRPLAKDKGIDGIKEMLNERKERYDKAADITIDTAGMQIQDICSAILDAIYEKEEK